MPPSATDTDSGNSSNPRVLPCYYCGAPQALDEIARVVDSDPDLSEVYHTILMKCRKCGGGLVFAIQEPSDEGLDKPTRVYPGEELPLGSAVPKVLQVEHAEAKKCYEAKAYTATAVMVGRTLEGLCELQGASGMNLAAGLKKLHGAGVIDSRLLEWADALRILRNEGAHFTGKQVSREDAFDTLKFCEALLEYVYVVSHRFEKFKARREQQEGREAPTRSSPTEIGRAHV